MKTLTFTARLDGDTQSGSRWGCGWTLDLAGSDHGTTMGEGIDIRATLRGHSLGPIESFRDRPIKITIEIQEPKVKLRSWRAEEVPLGCWVRLIGDRGRAWQPTQINAKAVVLVQGGGGCNWDIPFAKLADGYEHSVDGGKTWRPAGTEETVYE